MDRQERASDELLSAWHSGLVWLLVALVLVVGLSLWKRRPEVPAPVIQERWLQSLNLARGQWLQGQKGGQLAWRAPDGQTVTLVVDPLTGWPQPTPSCEFLWLALMGEPAEGLLKGVERPEADPTHCRYRLGERRVMSYFSHSGSVILSTVD